MLAPYCMHSGRFLQFLPGLLVVLAASCDSNPLANGTGGRGGTGLGSGGQAGTGTGAGGTSAGSGGAGGTSTGSGGAGRAGTGGANTAGAGGRGGSGGAGGTGRDDCRTDADCPKPGCSGPGCSEMLCALGPDGFHHCLLRTAPPLSACPTESDVSCCTSDAVCAAMVLGHCIPHSYYWCGGTAPPMGNACRYDACTGDADCTAGANGVCTIEYPRACIYGACRTNADCTAGPDGRCVLAKVGRFCSASGVFCRYSTDPCASDADCKGTGLGYGQACVPNAGGQGTSCKDVPPPVP